MTQQREPQFYRQDWADTTKEFVGKRVRLDVGHDDYLEFTVTADGVEVRAGDGRLVINHEVTNVVHVRSEARS